MDSRNIQIYEDITKFVADDDKKQEMTGLAHMLAGWLVVPFIMMRNTEKGSGLGEEVLR